MTMKFAAGLCAMLLASFVLSDGASAARKGEYHCKVKGPFGSYGFCKQLRNGKCSITVGDGTRVVMQCKELRRL